MTGWKKIARGMFGTGLVFGAGTTAVTLLVGVAAMIFGNATLNDLRFAGRIGVAGFILGVGFSGILAIASRSRRFTQLSIPKFAGLGAAAGLVYFLLISTNGYGVWSLKTAVLNFLLLTLMGSGAATATLLVARKASGGFASGNELYSVDEHAALGEGAARETSAASAYERQSVPRN
ncbi:MAG: hypothetical protein ABI852_03460 [Gemmatimonadaceae bacterium]